MAIDIRSAESRAAPGSPIGVVRLLEADPDLAEDLSPEALAAATAAAVVPVLGVEAGRWEAPTAPPGRGSALGLFVMDGLLLRTVTVRRRSSELVGRGDLIRPWQQDGEAGLVPCEVEWRVLRPARLALLDRRFAQAIASWPELLAAVTGRALRRSRSQSLLAAITSEPRIDIRLLTFFWQAADRWGRVTPEGIVIDLPLSHERLAELVGTRRPTVTTALGALSERGLLHRRDRSTWILTPEGQETLSTICGPGPH